MVAIGDPVSLLPEVPPAHHFQSVDQGRRKKRDEVIQFKNSLVCTDGTVLPVQVKPNLEEFFRFCIWNGLRSVTQDIHLLMNAVGRFFDCLL